MQPVALFLYRLGGRIYDAVHLTLTLGLEEKLKRDAVARLADSSCEVVCDWGVGSGLSAMHALSHIEGLKHLHLVDRENRMMARARRRLADLAVRKGVVLTWHEGDGLTLGLCRPCDAMIFSYSLSMLSDDGQISAMNMAKRNLKPDGHLLVIDMYPNEETKGLWARLSLRFFRHIAVHVYDVNFSAPLMSSLQAHFLQESLHKDKILQAFVFFGRNSPKAA